MKIKIAVAVGLNEDGKPNWNAYGNAIFDGWGEAMEGFELLENEQRYWVTAEVPDPVVTVPEIAGETASAPSEDEEALCADTASPRTEAAA